MTFYNTAEPKALAKTMRASRRPVSADNPLLALKQAASSWISTWLLARGNTRDMMTEHMFLTHDLTNTYFEGSAAANPGAARGRSDCELVTLGLVLDASGFVRRSRLFDGNVAEASTLEEMLDGLGAPEGALVIMDADIGTAANIAWLAAQKYRYLVVSRERGRQFDPAQAVEVLTASDETVRLPARAPRRHAVDRPPWVSTWTNRPPGELRAAGPVDMTVMLGNAT